MMLSFSGGLKVLGALLVLGLAGAYLAQRGTGELFEGAEEYGARERVRRVLEGLRVETTRQEAVCLWSTGNLSMADGPLDVVEDAFDAWAQQKGIVPVSAYEIVEARLLPMEPHTPGTGTVIVRARINGREHAIRVAPGQRLTWER